MERAGQESQDAGREIRLPAGARPDTGDAAEATGAMEAAEAAGSMSAARRPSVQEPGWRIGRCLGQGGAAAVWLAERPAEGTRFALKIPHSPGDTDEFELRRELAIRSRLRHENLLGVHGLLATADGPGLLLEYAPGDSLARLVAVRKTLSEGETVTVLVAVARALACLHAEGNAHGDVAPGNVLFTANGKPLLADFGTSRMLGEGRDAGVGTPGFTAPPPLPGTEGKVAGAALDADVYALGALGWFMLTGRPLVPGLRPPLRVLLPRLAAELRTLLDAALDDDPAQRPAAEKFAAEVFRARPAEPIDLLAAVHPSVRPELRTRRSILEQGKKPRKRRLARKGRRARKPPWEEADRWRGGLPRSAPSGPAEPAEPHRRRRAGARRARSPGWLGAAAVLVAMTTGLGGVAVLAPEVLRPAGEVELPGALGAGGSPVGAGEPSPGVDPTPAGAGDAGEPAPAGEHSPAGEPAPAGELSPGVPGSAGGTGASKAPAGAAAAAGIGENGSPAEAELSVLSGEDPVAAVRILSVLRARAFAEGDPVILSWVNQPGSAAETADLAGVELLHSRGERLAGLTVEVVRAERLGTSSSGPDSREQVALTTESSAYTQVGGDGVPTAAPGTAGRQEIVLEVVRTGQGWRIARVLPAAAGLEPDGGAQR